MSGINGLGAGTSGAEIVRASMEDSARLLQAMTDGKLALDEKMLRATASGLGEVVDQQA